tara:strand:- start:1347 stop:1877 length:531 start_codon:yes stop_codon:yes gene_type:complete
MSTIKVADLQHISNSNDSVSIASDSSVALKHSGNEKIATTATGVNITGTCTATSFSGSGLGIPVTGGTFTGSVVFEDAINENIFAITDASSVALDPDNGMVQTWTLGANRTATDSLTTGQSMLLIVTATASAYTLTWPTIKWNGGSAPTLGGANPTAIELFKVGSQLYGATVGDLS